MKKIIKTLLVVMVLAVVLTAFTGCDAVETLKGIIPSELAAMIPTQFTCSVLGHKGEAYSPCERCGEVWTESAQGRLECNSNGHIMKAYAEVPATCTEDGLSAGVVCTRCGYEERTRFTIPAKGHSMVDATCENPSTCSVCGYEEGEAAGHKPVDVEALAPTCSAVGHTAGTQCSVCKEILSGCEEIDIDPTAHKAVDVEALAPTCSTPGHTAGTACELCDEILSGCEEIDIDPDAHYFVSGICAICQKVFEYGVGDNTRVALDTLGVADDGSLYEFIYFYIPVAGHYKLAGENILVTVFTADGNFTLLAIGEGWLEAGVYVVGLNYYAGAGEYTFNVSTVDCTNTEEVTKAPTCTETGLKTTTCTVCGHVVEDVEVPVVNHEYTDGYCSCGAVDPDYYFTVTIPEALEKADGSKVQVSGTVVGIYQAYDSYYKNTSVYVADEAGNQILLFRLPGEWGLGDKLTVKGTISIYKGTAQIAQGATVVSSEKHVCSDFTPATCTEAAQCKICFKSSGEPLGHTTDNGVCENCGETFGNQPDAPTLGNPVNVTMKHTSSTTTNLSANTDCATNMGLDDSLFNVYAIKGTPNNNIGLNKAGDFRLYAYGNDGNTLSVEIAEGYVITSIEITFTGSSYAKNCQVKVDGEVVTTTTGSTTVTVDINSDSFELFNGNSGSTQVRISSVKITYAPIVTD